MITFARLWEQLDFYTFQQESAPAHTACDMVEFLDREMPDLMPPCCLVLNQCTFFIGELNNVHHRSKVGTDSTS